MSAEPTVASCVGQILESAKKSIQSLLELEMFFEELEMAPSAQQTLIRNISTAIQVSLDKVVSDTQTPLDKWKKLKNKPDWQPSEPVTS